MARILVPGALVLILGVYDDLVDATPPQKLIVETIAAALLWWMGIRITALPIFGHALTGPLAGFFLTTFWVVAVTKFIQPD